MSKWVIDFPEVERSRFRLFCFHCAGSGAGQFRSWADPARPHIRISAVQLPGRERRFAEAPLTDMRALIETMGPALRPHMDRPFALFGHSLGTLVAFELVRWLRQARLTLPLHLFVASRPAPQIVRDRRALDLMPAPELLKALERYGGIDPALLNEQRIGWFLPTIRADFALARFYRYEHQPALPVPISALYGPDDPHCNGPDMEAWSGHTSARFRIHCMPGGHFFLRSQYPGIVAHVLKALSVCPDEVGAG
jgi:medium-chain acyl-[acyl-carrier-protein] hydrolase